MNRYLGSYGRVAKFGVLGLALMLVVTACGGTSQSGGASPVSSANAAGIQTASQRLEAARKDPQFVAPGPAADASKARGKTVFYLAVTLAIPVVASLSRALKEAGAAAGVNVVIFDGKGSPAEFARGMDTAIATLKSGDVIIISGIPSTLLSAPVKRAHDAGIHIFVDSETVEGEPPLLTEVEATSNPNFPGTGRLMADEAIVDSGGKANLVVVVSQDIPDSAQVRDGIKAEFSELCPACKVTEVQTTAANWSSQIPTLVRTALTQDPTIGYFAPTFDGMVQFVVPAIRAAGVANKVKIVTSTTTPSVMDMLAKKDIVLADVDVLGGDWMSWAWMDQSIRLMTGASPVKFTRVPTRVFDRTNIASINPDAPSTTWFSTDFRAAYKKLWGIS